MRPDPRRLCLLLLLAFLCRAGFAHPMGNFSIDRYPRPTLPPNHIKLHHLLNLAEIPAYTTATHPPVLSRESGPIRQTSLAPGQHNTTANAAQPSQPMASPAHQLSAARVEQPRPLRANQRQTPHDRFTELITAQHLDPWFLFTATVIALSLGALHASEPGRGKTVVAAYLVGSRATARHAVLPGLIVTLSYTAGVFALGAVTLFASRYLVPEQLHPWLGLLSGLTIAGLGVYMLLRRLAGTATDHSHLPGQSAHFHLPFRPFPSRSSQTILQPDGPLTRRWLPILSSTFITVLGLAVALQSIAATHLTRRLVAGFLSKERLGPILFLTGLGLVLGMRHSTDADHVVAISTIVSKQRSIRNAAFIGSVWGLGHTIMIFAVGALIILAGIKIPPRVGLAMEFTVALMLILLGSLNLTGVTQKLMARYTPTARDISLDILARNNPAASPRAGQSPIQRFGLVQCVRPLIIGLVHGLAGSAAVALLVLSTIHNPVWATLYLLIFGFGTVIGMMIMTAAIAVPLTYAGERFSNMSRYFGITSGVISMCFGLFLVYQLGFVGGLFTSHPHWTPQ